MANPKHLATLKQRVEVWNQWRKKQADIRPDLSGAELLEWNLSGADLSFADLSGARLRKANLSFANLSEANFSRADLHRVDLSEADFSRATLYRAGLLNAFGFKTNFSGANLSEANLTEARLIEARLDRAKLDRAKLDRADLSRANLVEADLSGATLVGTDLSGANLTGCSIYGISAWNVELEGAKQESLVITPQNESMITVDNLKVAQFIYLLLNNKEIREVIDAVTAKVVLILGRFTPERKAVLDALRDELRKQNYTPVVFDFDKPTSRDITETVSTLAHLARFVIAVITDAKSIPQELMIIVPNLPSVPVQPLILESQHEYGMFEHFKRFPWVLPLYRYTDEKSLFQSLQAKVIVPAEQKAQELEKQ